MSIQYTVQGFEPTTSQHELFLITTRPWLGPQFPAILVQLSLHDYPSNVINSKS